MADAKQELEKPAPLQNDRPSEPGFRAHTLQAFVLVVTGLAILFGMISNEFLLAILLVAGHAIISAFIAHAIYLGDRPRKDFAIVCSAPNIAGYVFALLGGVFGYDRWLLISLCIFTLLAVCGMGRRLYLITLENEPGLLNRIPIVGRFLGPREGNGDKS